MTPPSGAPGRILAVDPAVRTLAFAVLEGSDTLVDWGRKEARADRNRTVIAGVRDLIAIYQPDLLVAEDCDDKDSRRRPAVRALIRQISAAAKAAGVPTAYVPRREVLSVFTEPAPKRTNKESVAHRIAERFPELAPSLPPRRRGWMSADPRIDLFDAVAFGLAYRQQERETPLAWVALPDR